MNNNQDVPNQIGKAISQAFVKTWLLIIEDEYLAGVSIDNGLRLGQNTARFWRLDEATERYATVIAYLPVEEIKRQMHSTTGEEFSYGDGYNAFSHAARWLPPFEYELTDYGQAVQDFLKWRNTMCFSSNHTTHIDYHLEFAICAASDTLSIAIPSIDSATLDSAQFQLYLLSKEYDRLDKESDDTSMIMEEMLANVEDILNNVLPDVLIAGPIETDNSWGIYPNLDEYPLLEQYL